MKEKTVNHKTKCDVSETWVFVAQEVEQVVH